MGERTANDGMRNRAQYPLVSFNDVLFNSRSRRTSRTCRDHDHDKISNPATVSGVKIP